VKRRNISLIAGAVIAAALLAVGAWNRHVYGAREAQHSLECTEKGIQWDKEHSVNEEISPSAQARSAIDACLDADVERSFLAGTDTCYKLARIVFVVCAIPSLWAFLLRRLAEVSKALSGKPPDAQ
jgi:hypothetical protein